MIRPVIDPHLLDDRSKISVLEASIVNIGRLCPDDMVITFSRKNGVTKAESIFPDGEVVTVRFNHHSPIYSVPVIPGISSDGMEVS